MCKFCRSPLRAPADVVGGSSSAAPAARSLPAGVGAPGRRTLIRGGSVLSVDPGVGDFAQGDVLIEGSRILQIAARIDAPDAIEIDATGHIVMPGFVDTHHHQFETALRSLLADAILEWLNPGAHCLESLARLLFRRGRARPLDVLASQRIHERKHSTALPSPPRIAPRRRRRRLLAGSPGAGGGDRDREAARGVGDAADAGASAEGGGGVVRLPVDHRRRRGG